jgi:ribosomal protein RSM22 (predicted rRNA methylase)
MLTAHLPAGLRSAIDELAGQYGLAELKAAAGRLSGAYRKHGGYRIDSPVEAAAYAASRMPATYAAAVCAMSDVRLSISSVLDLGAGTGAATWAAMSVFGASTEVRPNEPNPHLRAVGEKLLQGKVVWRSGDYRNLSGLARPDLAIFGYSLGEVAPGVALEVLERSYSLSTKGLVVVEAGTVNSFGFLLRARRLLIELGATITAPCPHQGDCPLVSGADWCHFAVRVERSRLHKLLKGGDAGFEDEKFTYLVALKEPPPDSGPFSRILRHPHIESGMVTLQLCTPAAGTVSLSVRSRDKARFKAARKADWGGRWAD